MGQARGPEDVSSQRLKKSLTPNQHMVVNLREKPGDRRTPQLAPLALQVIARCPGETTRVPQLLGTPRGTHTLVPGSARRQQRGCKHPQALSPYFCFKINFFKNTSFKFFF